MENDPFHQKVLGLVKRSLKVSVLKRRLLSFSLLDAFLSLPILQQEQVSRTSLAVQWLRFRAPNAGGPGSIPGLGRSPEKGMAIPFSRKLTNRGAWQAPAHKVAQSQTQLSDLYTLKKRTKRVRHRPQQPSWEKPQEGKLPLSHMAFLKECVQSQLELQDS